MAFLLAALCPFASAKDNSFLARITVYWASGGGGSDSSTRAHKCATGERLRNGHCAVDPRHIPFGSRVILPTGESLAAVDTGTAVKSRKAARLSGHTAEEKSALVIDRFFETKSQAMAWADSHPAFMPVKVVSSRMASKESQSAPVRASQGPAKPAAPASAPIKQAFFSRRSAS